MRTLICSFWRVTALATSIALVGTAPSEPAWAEEPTGESKPIDLFIYGGTSGGVAAAVQGRREGLTVTLVEPSQHLGGLSSGGLGWTDIGNKAAIGGVSREFYGAVREHYAKDDAWVHEQPEKYVHWQKAFDADAMWFFEPRVAEAIFDKWADDSGAKVVRGQRLDRTGGVDVVDGKIRSVRMTDGTVYRAKYFIDATYEGDLLAAAGVSYMVGREDCATFDETLNGVQVAQATKHQLQRGISPFVEKGNPQSGLLPGIDPTGPGVERGGDHRLQAYNFRMCLTDVPENRIAIEKPADYDERNYELLFRNFEAGETRAPWKPDRLPNRKTDVNNNYGFSTDYIGQNYAWPDADDETREKILEAHRSYQLGLMWTLQNHPRVPKSVRDQIGPWGLCKDEFKDNQGWPHQLYIREGRRMAGAYIMTQHDCQGRARAEDAVGLAAYTMDSHNTQRYITPAGDVQNEGDVQVGGFPPYPISYRSLTPKRDQVQNLLVPVALSSTHIAFGSIRMEPVFMVLGQSAASAAAIANKSDLAVQDVPYEELKTKLLEDEQILEWTGGGGSYGVDAKKLPGIVVDDKAAKKSGEWTESRAIGPFVGTGYLHDENEGRGQKSVTFPVTVDKAGRYEIRLIYSQNANRATNIPVRILHGGQEKSATVNQRKSKSEEIKTTDGKAVKLSFAPLATVELSAGESLEIEVANKGVDGYVVIDAVHLIPKR